MKKLTIIIFTSVFILTAFGQNGLKEGDCFLLSNGKKTILLNTYENNQIKEIKTFAITEESIFTTDQKTRVAILDTAKNNISLYDIQTSKEIKLSIPFNLKPKTILLNNENLFIGGEMVKEMLVQYHIESNEWHKLEIPTQVLFPGKAIDDLVVNDSLLIAIDNIVWPKYLLFYRLNPNGRLTFSHFNELKSNGPYESIYQGRITPNYFGLISGTNSGYTGASEHITIYDKLDLTRSFAISTGEREKNYHTFNDFLLIGNNLFIASKEKGFGIFQIKDSYFKVSKDRFDVFNADISATKIKYKQYKDEEVIRLTIIPNNTKIILTIRNRFGEIRHEIVDA